MGKKRKYSVTTKYVLLFGLLLLLTNVILALVMFQQSRSTVFELLRNNMLSISKTAADLMDGDLLKSFTQEDVGSPAWNGVKDELYVFMNNTDIAYIYTVRQTGPEQFSFIVDPDPVAPGEFGSAAILTPALISAGDGVSSVDLETTEDEWGTYYRAYSPVFDSSGQVAAIVGVDFDSRWYESQVEEHMLPSAFIIAVFLIICVSLVSIFSRKILKRLGMLNSQLSTLTVDVDELITELSDDVRVWEDSDGEDVPSGTDPEEESGDEIEILGHRLQKMQDEIKHYQDFAHDRACSDALTGVRNTTAYAETMESLNLQIREGNAEFCLAVFDINDLKKINDQFGHSTGDEIIRNAAWVLASVFGQEKTYRIGGDEFLVITDPLSQEVLREKLDQIQTAVSGYNADRTRALLSLSKGIAFYDKTLDHSFREVFVRADEAMYQEKQAFHVGRQ